MFLLVYYMFFDHLMVLDGVKDKTHQTVGTLLGMKKKTPCSFVHTKALLLGVH